MPTYSFRSIDTGEEFDAFMTVKELDKFLEDNTHLIQLLSAPCFLGANMDGGMLNNKPYDPKGKSDA